MKELKIALLSGVAVLAACEQSTMVGGRDAAMTGQGEDREAEPSQDANEAFDALLEEAQRRFFQLNPAYASVANISEEEAGGRYKDRFGPPGIEGYEANQEIVDEFEDRLRAFDPQALSEDRREWQSILLAESAIQERLDELEEENGYYLAGSFNSPYVVNQISGIHTELPQLMTQLHGLKTADDAEAYVTRLGLFDEQIGGAIELMEANAEAGAAPPSYALEGAIAQAEAFISMPAEENVLVTHIAGKLEELGVEDPEAFRTKTVEAVNQSVYPAYNALIASLQDILEDTTPEAGIWDIPDGSVLYDLLVKANGESELTGAGVHELGLQEVDRIHAEMEEIFREIGMTSGTVGERLKALTEDPDQLFGDDEEGREELLAYIRGLTKDAESVMDQYFYTTPENSVTIMPVPAYAQEGAAGGSYIPPAEDGSRPGTFMINLRTTKMHPRWTLPTLVYHETVPGHHFQLALATDAKGTPLLVRQSASSTGFAEGWGLYSEKFAEEIGMYEEDRLGDLGRLQAELFRAVRLVVDSGMHEKKWSREKAIEYMVENAGVERSDVESEIERYSVWPGQALAYKTGMIKIQELRERAEEALGEDFDIAAFHYEVLRDGGAPLAVLEERIERWIEEGGPKPQTD